MVAVLRASNLLRFLNTSLGVALCILPLRRLSLPGVSAAFRRASSALSACGVVGGPRLAVCLGPIRGVLLMCRPVEGGPAVGVRRVWGVVCFGATAASLRS